MKQILGGGFGGSVDPPQFMCKGCFPGNQQLPHYLPHISHMAFHGIFEFASSVGWDLGTYTYAHFACMHDCVGSNPLTTVN